MVNFIEWEKSRIVLITKIIRIFLTIQILQIKISSAENTVVKSSYVNGVISLELYKNEAAKSKRERIKINTKITYVDKKEYEYFDPGYSYTYKEAAVPIVFYVILYDVNTGKTPDELTKEQIKQLENEFKEHFAKQIIKLSERDQTNFSCLNMDFPANNHIKTLMYLKESGNYKLFMEKNNSLIIFDYNNDVDKYRVYKDYTENLIFPSKDGESNKYVVKQTFKYRVVPKEINVILTYRIGKTNVDKLSFTTKGPFEGINKRNIKYVVINNVSYRNEPKSESEFRIKTRLKRYDSDSYWEKYIPIRIFYEADTYTDDKKMIDELKNKLRDIINDGILDFNHLKEKFQNSMCFIYFGCSSGIITGYSINSSKFTEGKFVGDSYIQTYSDVIIRNWEDFGDANPKHLNNDYFCNPKTLNIIIHNPKKGKIKNERTERKKIGLKIDDESHTDIGKKEKKGKETQDLKNKKTKNLSKPIGTNQPKPTKQAPSEITTPKNGCCRANCSCKN